jgi:hypothetical protein
LEARFAASNYPNPFNPTTIINYALPTDAKVKINIYDIVGREITTLVDEFQSAGEHRAFFDARDLPSGIYFYRVQALGQSTSGKLLLVR